MLVGSVNNLLIQSYIADRTFRCVAEIGITRKKNIELSISHYLLLVFLLCTCYDFNFSDFYLIEQDLEFYIYVFFSFINCFC